MNNTRETTGSQCSPTAFPLSAVKMQRGEPPATWNTDLCLWSVGLQVMEEHPHQRQRRGFAAVYPQCEASSSSSVSRCVKWNAKQIQFHTVSYSTASIYVFQLYVDVAEPCRRFCPLPARCCSTANPARCGRLCCGQQVRAVPLRDFNLLHSEVLRPSSPQSPGVNGRHSNTVITFNTSVVSDKKTLR